MLPRLLFAVAGSVAAVINAPAYKHATWGLLVVDAKSGQTLYAHNAEQMFVPGSTKKLLSAAAALEVLGPDYRFVTPVYRRGDDLILRAVGDPNLTGRVTADGHLALTDVDHTNANAVSDAVAVDVDPLIGLDDLARQIAGSGVTSVRDVLVDDSFFRQLPGAADDPPSLSPVVINDNVIDVIVTPQGTRTRPVVKVETSSIATAHPPALRTIPIKNPAALARTLLTERLEARGVRITGDGTATLPDSYDGLPVIARHTSPPLSEALKVMLKVSLNLHAAMMPLLIGAHTGHGGNGEATNQAGIALRKMGISTEALSLSESGDTVDYASPRAMVELLRIMARRPDAAIFRDALPILGVDGSLAHAVGEGSPARGRVRAKTGTVVKGDNLNGRAVLVAKGLTGYMKAKSGRELVFAFYVNNVPLDESQDFAPHGEVLGRLCELFVSAY